MRHYEIVIIIHPDKTSDQVIKIVNSYKKFIIKNGGMVHRLEDWGRRQLAYPIMNFQKAYYVLMNIEIFSSKIVFLEEKFRFDQFVIRKMIICMKNKVVLPSPMLKIKDEIRNKKVDLISLVSN